MAVPEAYRGRGGSRSLGRRPRGRSSCSRRSDPRPARRSLSRANQRPARPSAVDLRRGSPPKRRQREDSRAAERRHESAHFKSLPGWRASQPAAYFCVSARTWRQHPLGYPLRSLSSSHLPIVRQSLSLAITPSCSGRPRAAAHRPGAPRASPRSRNEVVIWRSPRGCREFARSRLPRTRCSDGGRPLPAARA